MDSRTAVRVVVRDYLGSQPDVDPEELEVVFDDVYDTLERRFAEGGEAERGAVDDGLPFDASLVSGTVISMTCFVAMALLTAAIKAEGKSLAKRMLDRIEEKLTRQTGKPKMVHDIRRRIEHILDEL